MTIIQLNIPDALKESFDKAFPGEEPAAVLLRLLRDEIEQREQSRPQGLVDEILTFRSRVPPVDAAEIADARDEVRG